MKLCAILKKLSTVFFVSFCCFFLHKNITEANGQRRSIGAPTKLISYKGGFLMDTMSYRYPQCITPSYWRPGPQIPNSKGQLIITADAKCGTCPPKIVMKISSVGDTMYLSYPSVSVAYLKRSCQGGAVVNEGCSEYISPGVFCLWDKDEIQKEQLWQLGN